MSLCSLPLIASLFTACATPATLGTGYVEGEHRALAPVAVAEVKSLAVTRGERVAAGAVLARQEDRDAQIALDQASAALAQAESQLADLKEGKRPEEIRVMEAARSSAQAKLAEAERTAARTSALAARGTATKADSDDAETALNVARASLAEAEANLAVAALPARPAEIAAAEASVRGARADLARAEWALGKRTLTAPTDGVISDLLLYPGEMAGPSAPVLTLLPDAAVTLRLYVDEADIASIRPGTKLAVQCDGCAPGLRAEVSYIAEGPEFTPPVIYSLQNRQKLVYLVEARPIGAAALKPGQIVDVTRAEAAP
ncbi:HlyD family secretion protein [Rhodobacter maris]|uniref:HlyD family secretion protein n=1 Tax=Rhodobacter maris TaxID=446682 RepID=A0A285SL39_9RHOB|nr:HlyD family efflux transporter periplasmic adaptor subunit [Rhodobacter maris]SOC06708.1 HlyD family secretion protein [Rhodobacter maris]